MSKHSAEAVANLRNRIEQAQKSERWKDAIDLARSLAASAPDEANRQLFRNTALGFARSMADRGRTRDLAAELPKLVKLLPEDAGWKESLAQVAIEAGLLAEGLALLPGSDLAAYPKLAGTLADKSVRLGGNGRSQLPPVLQAEHAHILKAFALVEKGKDEEARLELQAIGLRSPFAEWRMFLRGLMAYHANDDIRAIEAWARLAADRLPFRLSAPLRMNIDPAFHKAQTDATRQGLQQQARKLTPSSMLARAVESLQAGIQQQRSLSREFAQLESLKTDLLALPPELRERVSRAIYWSLLPAPEEELRRYLRVFTPPREDPHLHRLKALACEQSQGPYEAQKAWLVYEKEVASNRNLWGDDTDRVRALLWLHAGTLASVPPEDVEEEDFYLGPFRNRRRGAQKPATAPEVCFKTARELGPDLVLAYIAPVQFLRDQDKSDKARPLANELRQKFPDNIDALMTAALVYADLEDIPTALECASQAAQINPLDARIKEIRKSYAMSLVLFHLGAGHLDQARESLPLARELATDNAEQMALRLLEGTIAWKAGDFGPLQKLREEMTATIDPAVLTYMIMVQANAANIDRKSRAALDREFKAILEGTLTARAAIHLGHAIAGQGKFSATPYRGYKTHRDKVARQLTKVATSTELQPKNYLELGRLLYDIKAKRALVHFAARIRGGSYNHNASAVSHYLDFLCDLQSGHGSFFGPPVYHLGRVEALLPTVADPDDRKFLEAELERYREEFNLEDFRSPMERLFGFQQGDEDEHP